MNVSEFIVKVTLDGTQAANDLDVFTKSVEALPDKAAKASAKAGEELKKSAKEAGEAAKDAAKKTQDAQKTLVVFGDKGVEAFNRIRSSAIRFFAAYASFSFAKSLIGGVMNANVAIGTLAKTSGEGIRSIDGLQRTFKALNVSEQEAAQGISAWRQALSNWAISGKLDPILKQARMLGVAVSQNGKERDFGDVLFDVGQRQLKRAGGDKSLAVRNMIAMGGFTPEQARAAVYGSRALYEEKKRNSVLTEEQIRQSEKLKQRLNEINERWGKISNTIAALFLPSVEKVVGKISELFGVVEDGVPRSNAGIKDMTGAINSATAAVLSLSSAFGAAFGWAQKLAYHVTAFLDKVNSPYDLNKGGKLTDADYYRNQIKEKEEEIARIENEAMGGEGFLENMGRVFNPHAEKNRLAVLREREKDGTPLSKEEKAEYDALLAKEKEGTLDKRDVKLSEEDKAKIAKLKEQLRDYRVKLAQAEKSEEINFDSPQGSPRDFDAPLAAPREFKGKAPEDIKGIISKAAKDVGFDDNIMLHIAKAESGFNPRAGAGSSSAKGLFQFTSGTWQTMVKRYGKQYGLTSGGVFDARQNSVAGALFMRDNAKKLAAAGLPVTPENIYMMHFMGETGGVNFLKKARVNGNAAGFSYTNDARSVGVANPTIFFKGFQKGTKFDDAKELARRYFRGENVGITPRTMREVYALMGKKVGATFDAKAYRSAPQAVNNTKNVNIKIDNLSLPNVKDTKDFAKSAANSFGVGAGKTTSAFR